MYTIKSTHRVCGGVSNAIDSSIDSVISASQDVRAKIEIPRLPGVSDYAAQLVLALNLPVSQQQMESRLYKATYEAVAIKDKKMQISPRGGDEWYRYVKNIYKAHRGSIKIANYGRAALVGYTMDVLQRDASSLPVTRVLASSLRPLDLLTHIV
jgi:hypothetical protein